MLKEKPATFSGIARAVDLALIVAAFAVTAIGCQDATHMMVLPWLRGIAPQQEVLHQYELLLLTSLIIWIAVTQWRESYRSHRADHLWPLLRDQVTTELLWAMAVAALTFFFKLNIVSRVFLLAFFPVSIVMLSARQLAVRAFLNQARKKGLNIRRIVVMGEPGCARKFARFIREEGGPGYRIAGLTTFSSANSGEIIKEDFDEAFLTLESAQADLECAVLKLLKMGKRVHIVPGLFDGTLFRRNLEEFAGVPVLSLGGYSVDPVEAAAKRLLDLIGASLLLILFAPILLLCALWVKLLSAGPVFFSQERLGRNGKRFRILKFRTMYPDAEARLHADPVLYQKYVENNFKLPKGEDPRIVPGGNFLRSSSLDELPQLFNVLKGDMSLVGPRPIVPPEIGQYGEYGPLFLSVKPGITGYWQVQGRSEIKDFSHRAALDIGYIRDQSLKTDVDILLKTIPAVLRRKGAH